MKSIYSVPMIFVFAATFWLAAFASGPLQKKVKTCPTARDELGLMFKIVPKESKLTLPAKWTEVARVDFDFDKDQKMDAAFLVKREFEPVFEDEDFDRPDKRVPAFLIVWLSHHGTPQILLPKAGTFSEATSTFLVETSLAMSKSGTGVLETRESTMMSMGGWSATTTAKKWRWEGGDLRLIGRTETELQRNTGQKTETDENLLTGKSIVTKESPVDPEKPSENQKMNQTVKAQKASPQKIYLSTEGHCDENPVRMKAGDI